MTLLIALGIAGMTFFVPRAEHRRPVIDGKTDEAFKKSFAAVRLSLPEPLHGAFDQATQLLWSATASMAVGSDPGEATKRWRTRLHGMDATAVLAASLQALVDTKGLLPANESAAVTMLRSISSAQAHCQSAATLDRNNNGTGEYVPLSDLTKLQVIPDTATALRGGTFSHGGYIFRLYLPGARASFVPAAGANVVDTGLAEGLWCAYAWPLVAGESGNRVFFVNQGGDVLTAVVENGRYSGIGSPPDPSAAFAFPMSDGSDAAGRVMMDSATAVEGGAGADGLAWTVVN